MLLWLLGNEGVKGPRSAVLTRTVHLVALVVTRRPAVTLPGHGDTLHLPTAAGELPRAAALLWNTTKSRPNVRSKKPAADGGEEGKAADVGSRSCDLP